MTLKEFVEKFDRPGSIVLLEGKRNVLKEDEGKLIRLGELLTQSTTRIRYRSGNAQGSDYYLTIKLDPKRLQNITPFNGHRKKFNKAYSTISLDEINLMNEPEIVLQSKANKKTEKLVHSYASGNRDFITTSKASFILRDTVKVLGSNSGIPPANFAFFYDDLKQPKAGGTGHTMNVCELNNVPYLTQTTWFTWLAIDEILTRFRFMLSKDLTLQLINHQFEDVIGLVRENKLSVVIKEYHERKVRYENGSFEFEDGNIVAYLDKGKENERLLINLIEGYNLARKISIRLQ